ncbi:MAG TPA: class I SAM-dependent methyltransferase [Pyrinomonadaceae bacterium]|nr:class I SAM-dependent methyltransferase [Pyrinomonadaceae bacterium]
MLDEMDENEISDRAQEATGAKVDRRAWSVFLKIFICAVASFTLLGGSLGSPLGQQFEHRHLEDDFSSFVKIAAPAAQQPKAAQTPARDADKLDRPTSDPYTGSLSIFEDAKREEKLQINRVMDVLQIKEGSRVADIGAGSGWFTVRAARRVGARGAVYAVEINEEYLKHIAGRAEQEKLANIRTVLGREDDPLLPARSVDAVLILKTYHEIAEPIRLMRNLRRALAPGALVGIIDRNGAGDDHGLDDKKVISEMERAGFALVAQHDFVKPDAMDYFLVFRARD